jgi:hypothetical protein
MSVTSNHYLAQAEACAREAAAATLDNVRDRCLRSEKSWRDMADRQLRAEAMRTRLAEEKADRDSVMI